MVGMIGSRHPTNLPAKNIVRTRQLSVKQMVVLATLYPARRASEERPVRVGKLTPAPPHWRVGLVCQKNQPRSCLRGRREPGSWGTQAQAGYGAVATSNEGCELPKTAPLLGGSPWVMSATSSR